MKAIGRRAVGAIRRWMLRGLGIDRRLDELAVNQGRLLALMQGQSPAGSLSDHEFKVFSQWGEDGILQFLTRNIMVPNRTFIEFGVEDFHESNCRFLLVKDAWSGYVIDGSSDNMRRLRAADFYWKGSLTARTAFITRENIRNLLEESGFEKRLGILSVDIDGNDYHVLEMLGDWQAAIVIVEYNAVFGPERAVSVPYDPGFVRSRAHSSNLYYGASLCAFAHLLFSRGYSLVGVNSVGSNAFFVRTELLNNSVRALSVGECFRDSRFRESRGSDGELTFLAGDARLAAIASMPLVDVITGKALRVGDLRGVDVARAGANP